MFNLNFLKLDHKKLKNIDITKYIYIYICKINVKYNIYITYYIRYYNENLL